MNLILPKTLVDVGSKPVIFLAGPITGAPKWQKEAAKYICEKDLDVFVASPSVHVDEYESVALKSDDVDKYQLAWEQKYLKAARDNGVVLFWLPKQITEMPVEEETGFTRNYGRDTAGELGRFGYGTLENEAYKNNVVVGFEEGFSGISVVQRNFLDVSPEFRFHKTLESTCDEALNIIDWNRRTNSYDLHPQKYV